MVCSTYGDASQDKRQHQEGSIVVSINQSGIIILIATVFAVSGCSDSSNPNPVEPAGVLPADPNEWVCDVNPSPPTTQEIAQWCSNNAANGIPLPPELRSPPPLTDLAAKNDYDQRLQDFLRAFAYENELNWAGDLQWRLTGPYVGEIGNGSNYGSHPAVQIFYSPEVVAWMCSDRSTELPDGAMIIKAMQDVNQDLGIELSNNACMSITEDPEPSGWTIIVKNSAASTDGWYWGYYGATGGSTGPTSPGNPPIVGLAALTSEAALEELEESTQRDPDFYPTGKVSGMLEKIPNVVFPSDGYGSYCIDCHASAVSESTFSSLDNVLTSGLRYRQFSSSSDTDAFDALEINPFVGLHDLSLETAVEGAEVFNPFPVPYSTPSDSFLNFYDQLSPVTYTQAMALSMPAETYDHGVAGQTKNPHGPSKFVTSDQCAGCHDGISLTGATPNMLFFDQTDDGTTILNLSPYAEWRASPMGLAGRDPIFFAQLESETNHLPQLSTCIQQTCLRCHGVMGSRQLAIDTPGQDTEDCESLYAITPPSGVPFGKAFTRDLVKQWPGSDNTEHQDYAALARDGISCTICHRVSTDSLGQENSYTGNFVTGPIDELYGPYADDTIVTTPMRNALDITPKFGEQLASAEMCGSCHNILLPVFDNDGTQTGASYEQSTHLEWTNSIYGPNGSDFQPCHVCHMSTHYKGEQLTTKIANIESSDSAPTAERVPDAEITLTERNEFSRHQLHGLNVFLNQMFQQFPLILGIRQVDGLPPADAIAPLLTAMNSMMNMAQEETAEVEITNVEVLPENQLSIQVKVVNHTGHYLPSGVGFRRVFLELLIRDEMDEPIWASGRTNELGAILDGTTEIVLASEQPGNFEEAIYQPHYQQITRGDQVQIYQEVITDSDGNITTSFLRRKTDLKNNRIKPEGYDPAVFTSSPSVYIQELAILPGDESSDPYYSDPALTGADTIEYLVTLTPQQMAQLDRVEVNLYNQSIPPYYLQERFTDASVGPMEMEDIQRLYYITSHLNTDSVNTEFGANVINSWKLRLSSDSQMIGP
jgi:hypothetical protein